MVKLLNSAEVAEWGHLPRLNLPGGSVLSRERWTLSQEVLAPVVAAPEAERYLAWRAIVERLGLPPLVHVRCGPDAAELLLRTDSPLAVRRQGLQALRSLAFLSYYRDDRTFAQLGYPGPMLVPRRGPT